MGAKNRHFSFVSTLSGDDRSGSNGLLHNGDMGAGGGESGAGAATGVVSANSLNGVLSHASDITSQMLTNGGAAASSSSSSHGATATNGDSSAAAAASPAEQQQQQQHHSSVDGHNGTDVNPSGTTVLRGTDLREESGLTVTVIDRIMTMHCGAKSGHFETSIIHFPTSEGVSEVSERASE